MTKFKLVGRKEDDCQKHFYLIWSPQGKTPLKVKHSSFEAALDEAERLVKQPHNLDREFYVLKAEAKVSAQGQTITTNLIDDLTPGKAIRKFCVECVGGNPVDVTNCMGEKCLNYNKGKCILFPYRMGKGRPSVKIISQFCLDCAGHAEEVKSCPFAPGKPLACPLYPYRFGTNPKRSGKGGNPGLKSVRE